MKKKLFIIFLYTCFLIPGLINAQNYDYLIITPDIFLQNTTWHTSLINLQTSRGFRPLLVSIPTTTSASQIKAYISSCYNNNPLKYVLLVGNGKNINPGPENPGVPYQYAQHGLVSNMASFQTGTYIPFYSIHSNTYWNSNGVDVASDDPYVSDLTSHGRVYIGRVPVKSIQEITNYVNKLYTYQNGNNSSNIYNSKEIILNLDVTHPTNLCTGTLVSILNNSLQQKIPNGITITELNVSNHYNGEVNNSDNSAFGYSYERQTLFENAVNSGASVISLLATAGGPNNLGGWYWADRSSSNLTNINTSLPFLIAPNCAQGEVNNPDYESAMRKLMITPNGGIIGAMAPTENSEQHANGYILNRFHDLIFLENRISYGEIFAQLKTELKVYYPDLPYFFNSFTYFGDPSLMPSINRDLVIPTTTVNIWETKSFSAINSIIAGNNVNIFLIDGNGSNGGTVTFSAGSKITLGPGFTSKKGSYFRTHIGGHSGVIPNGSIASSKLNSNNNTNNLITSNDSLQGELASIQSEISIKPIPKEFSLAQNYPNPCNPSTRIAYALPNESQVSLYVYNILGEQVAELVNQYQDAGYYSIDFDGSKLSSGIYIYLLKAGNFTSAKKFILMK